MGAFAAGIKSWNGDDGRKADWRIKLAEIYRSASDAIMVAPDLGGLAGVATPRRERIRRVSAPLLDGRRDRLDCPSLNQRPDRLC